MKPSPKQGFPARSVLTLLALLALLAGCAGKPPNPESSATGRNGALADSAGSASAPGKAAGARRSGDADTPAARLPAPQVPGSPQPQGQSGKSRPGGPVPPAGKPGMMSSTPASPAPPRAEPLIMENADRMEGFRSRGEYVLSGKVRFSHGALRLETERAVWLKDRSLIYAEAGMRISHRGAVLTSQRGSYDKNQGQATAEGQVRMRDSSGEVEAFGQNVTYLRFKHLANLTGSPEVRRYYRKAADTSAGAADRPPAAAGSPRAADTGKVTDTLVIRGRVLTYNDSAQVATADGDVRITRKNVHITCRKAEYHDRTDSLYLVGDPLVKVDESHVKGLVMRVGMNGEEIRSLLVKGDAQANTVEPATDTSAARQSKVTGDSLFLAFKEKAIDSVEVFRNTKGSYFDEDKPDFVNRMSGEYMVLRFKGKQVASANVMGGAKSTYFHLEKKAFKGKNDAEGDTIDFAFKDGKVEEVTVRGKAKGTYFGEPQTRKSIPGSRADSARIPPAGSAPAKGPAKGGAPAAPVPPAQSSKAQAPESGAKPATGTRSGPSGPPGPSGGDSAKKGKNGRTGQSSQIGHSGQSSQAARIDRPNHPWRKR